MNALPWLCHYDNETPAHIDYPDVPVTWFLEQAAKRFGERDCCVFQDSRISYERMYHLCRVLAGQLIAAGLCAGERVAVMLPNCPQFVLAFYAVILARGVVVAVNPAYKELELSFALNNSEARFAVVLDEVYNLVKSVQTGTKLETIFITSIYDRLDLDYVNQDSPAISAQKDQDKQLLTLLKNEAGDLVQAATTEEAVIFQYSGGTTGTPKAAIGTHRNLVANTLQFRTWLGSLEEGQETVLAAIPLYHVYGMVIAMNLGVALGAVLILISDPRNMDLVLASIEKHRATLFPGVPSMYQAIVQNQAVQDGMYDLQSIKACISGSAPLLPDVKLHFEELIGGKLLEGYGLSEAPTATHCNPLKGENRTGSIGLPLPDVEAKIVDIEDGITTQPPGTQGELVIRGPQVMPGYHANPEETRLTLRDGWLFTGDIAIMDEDGYFYLVGRKKEMIKVGGFQVWPREVEEVIACHPNVKECAVAGVPGSDKVEMVKAWVVLRSPSSTSGQEIIDWCDRLIARYKRPSEVEFVDALPRSGVGKVLKRELVRLHEESVKKRG